MNGRVRFKKLFNVDVAWTVSVRSDRSAADRVGRVVSALDSGQYGVFGGSANETALD